MENLYEILNVKIEASLEEIKKSYMSLVRLHHPDKKIQHKTNADSKDSSETFINIDRAWKILCNPISRAQYDALWHERTQVQDLPIQDTVSFGEFDAEDNIFTFPCRCGSQYELTETESNFHYDIVCCGSCSLTIKVIYD